MDITQFLQQQWYSRRHIVNLLQDSCIKKNDTTISFRKEPVELGDTVLVHGDDEDKTYIVQWEQERTIILYNKPIWLVVSNDDPHNTTIFSQLPEEFHTGFYYIGRLDKDSHGLLVLTNIPALVSYFSHPRHQHRKVYQIKTYNPIRPEDREKWKRWVLYFDADAHASIQLRWDECKEIVDKKSGEISYEVYLSEWKKRHIRRLCESLWYTVMDLKRVSFWPWSLGNLAEWERKKITISSSDLESLLAS